LTQAGPAAIGSGKAAGCGRLESIRFNGCVSVIEEAQ